MKRIFMKVFCRCFNRTPAEAWQTTRSSIVAAAIIAVLLATAALLIIALHVLGHMLEKGL
jgi:hypothetical protein